MAKAVLLSLGERKKPVKIPVGTKEEIPFIKARVTALFGVDETSKITIQQFSEDWGEYIDLEDDEVVCDKDRLKVVVERSPDPREEPKVDEIIHDETPPSEVSCPGTSQNDEVNSYGENFQDNTIESFLVGCQSTLHGEMSDAEATCDEEATCSLPNALPDEGEDSKECVGSGSGRKRPFELVDVKAVKKIKEEVVLPDPFPLPANYRADVEVALSTGQITRITRAAFLSSVADAMFAYKRYPSRDDYVIVAKQIIHKYPFFGTGKKNDKHEGLVEGLIDRFKGKRRTKKPKGSKIQSTADHIQKPLPKRPSKTKSAKKTDQLPPIPAGEDSVSFKRHCRILETEWRKNKRSLVVVDELMTRTFAFRRREILEKGEKGVHVQEILEKYPFLNDPDQLLKELKRICPTTDTKGEDWRNIEECILKQAQLESKSGTSFKHNYSLLQSQGLDDTLMALSVLPYLLPDPRSKGDHNKILVFVEESQPIAEATEDGPDQPYALVVGEVDNPQTFLVVDNTVLCEIDEVVNIPLYLLAAFYSFNIKYPPGCHNCFAFLEHMFLKCGSKLSPSVKLFKATLDNIRSQ